MGCGGRTFGVSLKSVSTVNVIVLPGTRSSRLRFTLGDVAAKARSAAAPAENTQFHVEMGGGGGEEKVEARTRRGRGRGEEERRRWAGGEGVVDSRRR